MRHYFGVLFRIPIAFHFYSFVFSYRGRWLGLFLLITKLIDSLID